MSASLANAINRSVMTRSDVVRNDLCRCEQLAIADRYAIGSDGSLFIKHDFTIEDVKKLLLPARDSSTAS